MATYYIHFELGNDATAVAGDWTKPRKTLPGNGYLVAANNKYLLAAGVIYQVTGQGGGITIASIEGIEVGCYDPLTGIEILNQPNPWLRSKQQSWLTTEEKQKYYAIVDGGTTPDFNVDGYVNSRGLIFQGNRSAKVRGIWFRNFQHSGAQFHNTGIGTTDNSITDCIISDIQRTTNTTSHYGACGVRAESNCLRPVVSRIWFENIGEDCLWMNGAKDLKLNQCWARNLATKQGYDDQHCDFLQLDSYPGSGLLVENNYVEHLLGNTLINVVSNSGYRTGACIMSTGAAGTDTPGGIIRNNVFISNYQGAYFQRQSGLIVTGNEIHLKYRSNMPNSIHWTFEQPNSHFVGNVCTSEYPNIWYLVASSTSTGLKIANNTFKNLAGSGTSVGTSVGSVPSISLSNNIFMGLNVGIADSSNSKVKENNIFFNCTYSMSTSSSPSSHSTDLALGTNLEIDPLLDSSYRPLPGSPCLGTGKFVGYYSDILGVPFKSNPSIGAVESWGRKGKSLVRTKRSIK